MRRNGAQCPKERMQNMKKKTDRTGIGMYTVHRSVQADMYRTFLSLADMGYEGIEFYGEPGFDLNLLKRSLRDSELDLAGWQIEWSNLQEDRFGETVKYLQAAGCPAAIIPCLGGRWQVAHRPEEECREIWLRYVEKINAISEKLFREGIRTGYHNHEHEFQLSYEGKKVFDLLFDGLSEHVIIEFDTGNCIEGGDDPLRILKKYRGRAMFLHLKPFSHEAGFETLLGAAEDANDWKSILDICNGNCMWLLVESENTKLPEMKNAQLCMQGLKQYI